ALILTGILFLLKRKHFHSGAFLGAAVAVKLNPLMLTPVFIKGLPDRSRWSFFVGCALVVVTLLTPLLWGNSLTGYLTSLGLYANAFEFNASVYYLLRGLGHWTHGYNMIGILGPGLKWLTLLTIV